MKIAIDISIMQRPLSGIGRYTINLVNALLKLDNTNEYIFFTNYKSRMVSSNSHSTSMVSKMKNYLVKEIIVQSWLPLWLKKNDVQIFYVPESYAFGGLPRLHICKYIVTCYDLIPLKFPYLCDDSMKHFIYRKYMSYIAQKADHIITISECSKKDIVDLLKVDNSKISVIYPAHDKMFKLLNKNDARIFSKDKYKLEKFILTVSEAGRRKNVDKLIRAFSNLSADLKHECKLVIVGRGWEGTNIMDLARELHVEHHIKIIGFIPDNDLCMLYNAAEMFVYPSIYEGFGLPVLEAMACGIPVITSNCSSLPEVADDAAILINPEDESEITRAITNLLTDESLRNTLVRKGLKRIKNFSWEKTAKKTLELFKDAGNKK